MEYQIFEAYEEQEDGSLTLKPVWVDIFQEHRMLQLLLKWEELKTETLIRLSDGTPYEWVQDIFLHQAKKIRETMGICCTTHVILREKHHFDSYQELMKVY